MEEFVGRGLAIQERLGITDKKGKGIVMRFAKLYSLVKLAKICKKAESYYWFHWLL